jgi:hypothetical protein
VQSKPNIIFCFFCFIYQILRTWTVLTGSKVAEITSTPFVSVHRCSTVDLQPQEGRNDLELISYAVTLKQEHVYCSPLTPLYLLDSTYPFVCKYIYISTYRNPTKVLCIITAIYQFLRLCVYLPD